LKAKETEVMEENKGQEFGDFVAFSLLSQRHLRQTDFSMDEDSRDILQLLEDNTEYFFLVLEFIEAVRLLQLRENHYKEMIRSLKSCNQEKFVDDANITSNEVKKFREQKMRKLKEQLKHFLEKKKTPNISSSFDPFQAPEFSLAVASSLPQSHVPGNAFSNSFFYQNSEKKLFILRECLGSGGGFLLLLVHCWAHVTAGDLSHDTNPLFLSLFHQALKACLSEMFSLRLQLSAAAPGNKSQGINQVLLKEEPFSTEEINLISQLLEVRVKNLTDMEALEKNLLLRVKSEESLSNKWLVKKKENFLHALSSSGREILGQRAHLEEETVDSLSPSELEDKVDALTEELVQILEDEQQFLSSEGNEDLLSYYLEITSLEKESLGKQINELEEEIAQGRKFASLHLIPKSGL
ncbi:hypothetical protein IHE44_0008618, partial [Lamprotornis superbus]